MAIVLREVEIYRPYDNEFPAELLWEAGADETYVDRWEAADLVRIAKIADRVLGMYAMSRIDAVSFYLLGVVVEPSVRRQGLGRWLVGHAIGVAESKGGRHVLTPKATTRLFARIGFTHSEGQESEVQESQGRVAETQNGDLRLDLIPE